MKITCVTAAVVCGTLASCIPPEPPPRYRDNPYGYRQPPTYGNDVAQRQDYLVEPQQPQPQPQAPAPTPGTYPTATRTTNPDQVISPYEPFNVIDISEPRIESGKLARDPSNNKIFRVP